MNVTRKLKGVELEPFLKISLFIWFDPYVNWLCVFSKVNPFFQKAQVFCMDLQPAADPYNVVCNLGLRYFTQTQQKIIINSFPLLNMLNASSL